MYTIKEEERNKTTFSNQLAYKNFDGFFCYFYDDHFMVKSELYRQVGNQLADQ